MNWFFKPVKIKLGPRMELYRAILITCYLSLVPITIIMLRPPTELYVFWLIYSMYILGLINSLIYFALYFRLMIKQQKKTIARKTAAGRPARPRNRVVQISRSDARTFYEIELRSDRILFFVYTRVLTA